MVMDASRTNATQAKIAILLPQLLAARARCRSLEEELDTTRWTTDRLKRLDHKRDKQVQVLRSKLKASKAIATKCASEAEKWKSFYRTVSKVQRARISMTDVRLSQAEACLSEVHTEKEEWLKERAEMQDIVASLEDTVSVLQDEIRVMSEENATVISELEIQAEDALSQVVSTTALAQRLTTSRDSLRIELTDTRHELADVKAKQVAYIRSLCNNLCNKFDELCHGNNIEVDSEHSGTAVDEEAQREHVSDEGEMEMVSEYLQHDADSEKSDAEEAEEALLAWQKATDRETATWNAIDDRLISSLDGIWSGEKAWMRYSGRIDGFSAGSFNKDRPLTTIRIPWPTLGDPSVPTDWRPEAAIEEVKAFCEYIAKTTGSEESCGRRLRILQSAFDLEGNGWDAGLESVIDVDERNAIEDAVEIVYRVVSDVMHERGEGPSVQDVDAEDKEALVEGDDLVGGPTSEVDSEEVDDETY